ncbi:small multi-drug export protein, partial [Patescibacteria group bacterium]|nr:small multi-drug export protein [Patescibacteria group bacterium]
MDFELKTILLAMTPINELRGTIPLAIGLWHLSPLKAFFLAVIGNMIPIFFLLWFWKHLAGYLMKKSKTIKQFFNWLFKRTQQRFYKNHSAYGDIALILLVAIPLPFTGAWTGSVAAFLFNIPYKKSLGLIFIGV